MKQFQDNLLESVSQMKAGEAARVTTVAALATSEAPNRVGENAAADCDVEPGGVGNLKAVGAVKSQ